MFRCLGPLMMFRCLGPTMFRIRGDPLMFGRLALTMSMRAMLLVCWRLMPPMLNMDQTGLHIGAEHNT